MYKSGEQQVRERTIALFGAGKLTRELLKNKELSNKVELIVDNNNQICGDTICNKRIKSLNDLTNIRDYYYVVTVYYSDIADQLNNLSLKEGDDYCSVDEWLYDECFVLPEDLRSESELFCRVANKREYEDAIKNMKNDFAYQDDLYRFYSKNASNFGVYRGFCAICNKQTFFRFYKYEDGQISWRETGTDMVCSCNSRIRYTFSYVMDNRNKDVYISEQVTPLYRELKKRIPSLIGSEYLTPGEKNRGKEIDGVRNEDATALSFQNESFDLMVYCDVFEHISEYKKALKETHRCLKMNGKLFFTVPFYWDNDKSITRAYYDKDNDSVVHLLPPQYHGNPISEEGSLVFNEFGWDILDSIRDCGFREVNMIIYWSASQAYFSVGPGIAFEAVK